jgi:hypothetical protein
MTEKRYFLRIERPGWGGRHLSIDDATLEQVQAWLFSHLVPKLPIDQPEPFRIVQFDVIEVDEFGFPVIQP